MTDTRAIHPSASMTSCGTPMPKKGIRRFLPAELLGSTAKNLARPQLLRELDTMHRELVRLSRAVLLAGAGPIRPARGPRPGPADPPERPAQRAGEPDDARAEASGPSIGADGPETPAPESASDAAPAVDGPATSEAATTGDATSAMDGPETVPAETTRAETEPAVEGAEASAPAAATPSAEPGDEMEGSGASTAERTESSEYGDAAVAVAFSTESLSAVDLGDSPSTEVFSDVEVLALALDVEVAAPVSGYDGLGRRRRVGFLKRCTEDELRTLRAFEAASRNRASALQQVDRELAVRARTTRLRGGASE